MLMVPHEEKRNKTKPPSQNSGIVCLASPHPPRNSRLRQEGPGQQVGDRHHDDCGHDELHLQRLINHTVTTRFDDAVHYPHPQKSPDRNTRRRPKTGKSTGKKSIKGGVMLQTLDMRVGRTFHRNWRFFSRGESERRLRHAGERMREGKDDEKNVRTS